MKQKVLVTSFTIPEHFDLNDQQKRSCPGLILAPLIMYKYNKHTLYIHFFIELETLIIQSRKAQSSLHFIKEPSYCAFSVNV